MLIFFKSNQLNCVGELVCCYKNIKESDWIMLYVGTLVFGSKYLNGMLVRTVEY